MEHSVFLPIQTAHFERNKGDVFPFLFVMNINKDRDVREELMCETLGLKG